MRRWQRSLLASVAVGAFASGVFLNALEGDFVFDDAYAIVQNPDVYSSSPWFQVFWHDFWGFPLLSDKSHKSYRPLTTLTFRLQMSYAGDRADSAARMMHSLNVFLHSLNSALLVFLFQTFGFRVGESMLGALLFACHPVHIEAVASLVGRAELLAALLSILSLLSHSTPLALVLAGLALLCKETAAVVALPLCSCLQLRKSRLKALLPILWLCLLIPLRLLLHGGMQARPFLHRESNPGAFAEDWLSRILTLHYYLFRHLQLLVWPHPLCCDWSHGSIPLLESPADLRVAAFWVYALPAGLLKVSRIREGSHTGVILSSLLIFLSLLPASNLLFSVGFTVAERVLYLPSLGFCGILGHVLGRGTGATGQRCLRLGVAGVVLALWSYSCLQHSRAWWTAEALYRAGLQANPRNEKLHDLLATRLQNSGGDLQEATWHAEQAIALNPFYWHAHASLGQLKSAAGQRAQAVKHYKRALRLAEQQHLDDVADAPKVRLNLAVMLQDSDAKAAEHHFRRFEEAASQELRQMGLLIFGAFLESRDPKEAAERYEQALRDQGPHHGVAHLRLGSLLRRLANASAASGAAAPAAVQRVATPKATQASPKQRSEGNETEAPGLRVGDSWRAAWGQCWRRAVPWSVPCLPDWDLVEKDGTCKRDIPPTWQVLRRWWRCMWTFANSGEQGSCRLKTTDASGRAEVETETEILSTWPLPATEERALHHLQQGLLTSAPSALDPGGRKRREAMAVVGARLTLARRHGEARALLGAAPQEVLPQLATEQLKVGNAAVALEAFRAAASLQQTARTHLGIAAALEQLGQAGAEHHRQLAAKSQKRKREKGAEWIADRRDKNLRSLQHWICKALVVLGALAGKLGRCSSFPSVSVQVVTLNRPQLLLEAMHQVEAQDYEGPLEVLIMDDSEQSNSQQVEQFASTSRHSIKYCFLPERLTIGAKRNLAARKTTADLICTWDDDDIYTIDRVRLQVEFLMNHPRCNCVMLERRYFFWTSTCVLKVNLVRLCCWKIRCASIGAGFRAAASTKPR
ncbi:unnamed protein product [Effrenium voratum]|nr:unnamed protein product [Effrenium voratum]